MKINIADNYDELSLQASELILEDIKKNKNLLLCTATGGSPTQTYQLLAEKYNKQPKLFEQLRILKLDEWGGIPMNHPATCESYLQTHIIQPLHIAESRYNGFVSNPADPLTECMRVQQIIDTEGPIDVCVLGLGMNGHVAFNEPAAHLQPHCHVAELSDVSLQHPMAAEMQVKPAYGLTLGMADILHSKSILILISGTEKKNVVSQFLSKKITSFLPASFLWLHPNVTCLIESSAMQ